MTLFRYRAVHPSGQIQTGTADAAHEQELAQRLRAASFELIEARAQSARLTPTFSFRSAQPAPTATLALVQQMASLLSAGVPVLTTLNQVTAIQTDPRLLAFVGTLSRDVASGASLSEAFARQPAWVDAVFVALLRAGEAGGDLGASFAECARYLRWKNDLARRWRKALRYPLFLLGLAAAVTGFMTSFVVPQIVGFLVTLEGELPLSTRLLIGLAEIGTAVFLWGGGLLILTTGSVFAAYRHSARFAERIDALILRLPAIGTVRRELSLARYSGCLALLLRHRVILPEALVMARPALDNRALVARAKAAEAALQNGTSFAAATHALFPPLSFQILRVGEESGQLSQALHDIAVAHEATGLDKIDALIGGLEPALTLMMGGLLAWIVLAVLGPIYGSLGQIGQTP